jgi:hypothetical protein
MAEPNIVGSLFGVTPELYQEQRDLMRQKQAMAFAQQDPRAQATFGLYRAGQQVGQALGGLMGAEDPQMRLISQRNALAKQIDMNDPESIMRGAQMAAQSGDTVAAGQLAEYARKAASDLALIQQRLRERQGIDPIQQLIRAGKHTPQSIDLYSKSGNIQDLELIEKPAKGPTPTEIERLQLYRQQLIDSKAPASQIAEVDAVIKGASSPRGTVVQNVMPEYPGDKKFADIPAFRSSVQKTVEPMSKVVFATDNALTNINDSIKTNNFASFRAAQVQFARAIAGSGDLSQKELLAAGADPAILGGTADYISRLFSSTPTIDTQNKIKSTLGAIRTVSVNKANEEIDRQRKIALRNKNYNPQDVETALDFPEFKKPMGGTGPFTDAEKEQRYQEYKRKQSGAKE